MQFFLCKIFYFGKNFGNFLKLKNVKFVKFESNFNFNSRNSYLVFYSFFFLNVHIIVATCTIACANCAACNLSLHILVINSVSKFSKISFISVRMTTTEVSLCSAILEDLFGSIVAKVGVVLISYGAAQINRLRKRFESDLSFYEVGSVFFLILSPEGTFGYSEDYLLNEAHHPFAAFLSICKHKS